MSAISTHKQKFKAIALHEASRHVSEILLLRRFLIFVFCDPEFAHFSRPTKEPIFTLFDSVIAFLEGEICKKFPFPPFLAQELHKKSMNRHFQAKLT